VSRAQSTHARTPAHHITNDVRLVVIIDAFTVHIGRARGGVGKFMCTHTLSTDTFARIERCARVCAQIHQQTCGRSVVVSDHIAIATRPQGATRHVVRHADVDAADWVDTGVVER
jgi:hypothetical protein